jgi:hypothetical protein
MTEALPPTPPECLPPKDPFELNEDCTAKDPVAFREALRADPVKMEALEKEPNVAAIVLGDDIPAFQELLKSVVEVSLGLQARRDRPRANGGALKATGHRPRAPPCINHLLLPLLRRRTRSGRRSTSRACRSGPSMRSA